MRLFLQKRKYELLLAALIQHLFIGIFLSDLAFYTKVVWPINMLILGMASIGVFIEKGRWKKGMKNVLLLLVIFLPLALPFMAEFSAFMLALNICYCLFYLFIFYEVFQFLIKPSYINADIITASACGYFLLIEISVFLLQLCYYWDTNSFKGVHSPYSIANSADIFMDLVYFCSITITSIGFGDITPNTHHTKLITSFLGIAGQFYSVVLVGILISKFTSINHS